MTIGRVGPVIRQQTRAFCSKPAANTGSEQAKKAASGLWEKVKEYVLFDKDATPYVNYGDHSITGKGYRYPSPGSQGEANVPMYETKEEIYDTKRYTRDTERNMPSAIVISPEDKMYIIGDRAHPTASKGRPNADVLRYDPTGTRSAMTTSQAEMLKMINLHRPDHLPKPFFRTDGSESLVDEAARKGLAGLIGRQAKWSNGGAVYEEVEIKN